MRFCLYFKIYITCCTSPSIILYLCCYYKLLSHCPRLISEYPVDKIDLVWVARLPQLRLADLIETGATWIYNAAT